MPFLSSLFVLIGVFGFFIAWESRGRISRLERQHRSLQAELAALWTRLSANPVVAPPPAEMRAEEPVQAESPVEMPAEPAPEPEAEPIDWPKPEPRVKPSLEELIGTRWVVYLGGLALALGGLLLVRYAIEQGFFGPGARVFLGLVLSAVLIVAGEKLRRREVESGEATPTPAVLTAAGTTAGFGAIYSAHALYGFIGPALALLALGAAGMGALAAALLHGPALAGLGLAGALAAPLLVHSAQPSPWPILVYVAVTVASAYALARLRQWSWLAISATVGGAVWGAALAAGAQPAFQTAAELHIVLQLGMAIFVYVLDDRALTPDPGQNLILAEAVPLGFAALAMLLLSHCAHHGAFDTLWLMAALACVGFLAAGGAARVVRAPGLLLGAGVFAAGLLLFWPSITTFLSLIEAPPLHRVRFLGFAALSGALVVWLAANALWRARQLQHQAAALLGGAIALSPLVLLVVCYTRLAWAEINLNFGFVALGLAGLYLGLGGAFRARDSEEAHDRLSLGLMAVATIAALALGLTFTLECGELTVAFALSALGAAYVESRLGIPLLRRAIVGIGLLVSLRLVWDPRIVGDDLGTRPIFNWLLFGYGVPAVCFALVARWLGRASEDLATQVSQALAVLFSALLAFFEIRHALNGGDIYARDTGLIEQGLFVITALGFAAVLMRLDAARARRVFRFSAIGFSGFSALVALLELVFRHNPYFDSEPIEGGTWLNALLLGYALPAAAAALLANLPAVQTATGRPVWFVTLNRIAALILAFLYVTLETRRIFQGAAIGWELGAEPGETYAYSAVWLGFGVALLAYGLWRMSLEARIASAVVILLAVFKVFFFDLANLAGALRAFSFIGLGAVLIGIGLVYQKFVFRPERTGRSGEQGDV